MAPAGRFGQARQAREDVLKCAHGAYRRAVDASENQRHRRPDGQGCSGSGQSERKNLDLCGPMKPEGEGGRHRHEERRDDGKHRQCHRDARPAQQTPYGEGAFIWFVDFAHD